MKPILRISIISLCYFLFSCNATVSTLKQDAEVITADDTQKGYLLLGVETNYNLKNIDIDGPQDIRLTHVDLKSGSNFILIPLTSGYYTIDRIAVSNFAKFGFEQSDNWRFEIKPQTISYVGHLEFKNKGYYSSESTVVLMNRSTEALIYMEQAFPSILNNREIYYGGPGNDDLFEFLRTLGE